MDKVLRSLWRGFLHLGLIVLIGLTGAGIFELLKVNKETAVIIALVLAWLGCAAVAWDDKK